MSSEIENEETDIVCLHENMIEEKGFCVCTDCGEEMVSTSRAQTSSYLDTTRIQMKKTEEVGIFKDVESMNFSSKIVAEANKIYMCVTNGKILRGNSRKAIIFACVFHAFKAEGKTQTHERLLEKFKLNKKTGLMGLNKVNLKIPKESPLRLSSITPVDLINEIMDKFSASPEQKNEVIQIYNSIKNKSSILNRCRPQSVSSGIIFYWICKNRKNISIESFREKVMPSESTIIKMAKEISRILGDNIEIIGA